MAVTNPNPSGDTTQKSRPPLAAVGSQVSFEEEMFGAAFDGVVLRRFWGFVSHYRRMLMIGIAAVITFTMTQVLIPLLIRYAVDDALIAGPDGLDLLHTIAIGFFVIVVINYAANMIQELVVGRIAGHILFDLRRAMFAHLQYVSIRFMDKTEVGRLMSRLQGDVNALQEFLETSIIAVGDIVLLFGIISVLLWLDTELGLLTLIVVPSLLIARIVWLPRARKIFLHARETSSIVNGALAENVHGIRTIQAMTRETVNFDLFRDKADENLQAFMRSSLYANMMVPVVDTLTGIALAIIVLIGGQRVLDGTLDLGIMVAFIFYVQRFFDPIRSLTIQYSVMQRAMASGQRIFEVLDVPIDVKDSPTASPLVDHDGSVCFENVTFGYEPDRPILQDISFVANPGETIALVGPTGSGKTSITALAHRFYDPWKGRISVGGRDLQSITLASLGEEMAIVLQEPYLFSGTIIDNIRYNKLDASSEQVQAAAKAVGAHEFIMELPQGYQSELDQRGSNLSLGQRQLLSFARALVADAKILILDEATASIDSHTERQIQLALAHLLEGRTAIVIAHRLATIRNADRILVLRDGRLIEEGTHDMLSQADGLYSKLYRMNYASFDDLVEDTKG